MDKLSLLHFFDPYRERIEKLEEKAFEIEKRFKASERKIKKIQDDMIREREQKRIHDCEKTEMEEIDSLNRLEWFPDSISHE